jgi:3-keto-L-gulonate-6-phosphate decarboxylase
MEVSEPIIDRSAADGPVIQLSIDVIDLPSAIEVGKMGLRAGVDWLEFGTPLIAWVGINSFGDFLAAFPGRTTFLDAKVMDGSQPYVHFAGELGIDMVSICGAAADAAMQAGVAMARDNGVKVVADLCGVRQPVERAEELLDLDVDGIYLHYGWDEFNANPGGDVTLDQLAELRKRTELPLGIVTSGVEMAKDAVALGADVLLVGHPFLLGDEAEEQLTDYVAQVRAVAARS